MTCSEQDPTAQGGDGHGDVVAERAAPIIGAQGAAAARLSTSARCDWRRGNIFASTQP
jgi:hypothetical protein